MCIEFGLSKSLLMIFPLQQFEKKLKYICMARFHGFTNKCSGVFSTGAMGAMAPVILRKRLIAPAVSNRNGKILLTLGTRTIKILNTLLSKVQL